MNAYEKLLAQKAIDDLSDIIEPIVKAYHKGKEAGSNLEYTLQDCPYSNYTSECKAWMRGYNKGKNGVPVY